MEPSGTSGHDQGTAQGRMVRQAGLVHWLEAYLRVREHTHITVPVRELSNRKIYKQVY
ncbi:hypothetical protein PPUN109347_23380 [Pseudomonas putida]|nr:hypothetical protein PPUN109347_23380 [Pseudomonas putida]